MPRLVPPPTRLAPPIVPALLAVACYAWLWPYFTGDVPQSYVPWLEHIVARGPVAAFAAPFGDYSPPYLYLLALVSPLVPTIGGTACVKLVSTASTVALALAVHRLLRALDVPHPARIAAWVPLVPSVALNAVLMGSCDALWAAPCVMAVACAVERRHPAMLAWCGVALAIKAQAMFGAPFFLALLIARGVPFRLWPITPLVAAALFAPAWAAGWPAGDLATIYFRQAGFFDDLSRNAPNLWAVVQGLPGARSLPLSGLANVAAIGAAAFYTARTSILPLAGRTLVAAAMLAPMATVGLLPRMHERYFFLADVLALVHAALGRSRATTADAALVQLGSMLGILAYLTGIAPLAGMGAVAMLTATFRVARRLYALPANDNPRLAPA